MRPINVLAGLLAFLTAQPALALPVPVPEECGCKTSPLSLSSFEQAKIIINARRLTPEECAFICNPHGTTVEPTKTETSPPAEQPAEPRPEEGGDAGPPLFDPVAPRPLPLFDSPQQRLVVDLNEPHSQPRPPPLPLNRAPALEQKSQPVQPTQLSINTLYTQPIQPPISVAGLDTRVSCSVLQLFVWLLLLMISAVVIVRIGCFAMSACKR